MAYRKKNPPNPPLNRCIDCGCPIPISRVRQLCKDCDVQKSSDSFERAWRLVKAEEPPYDVEDEPHNEDAYIVGPPITCPDCGDTDASMMREPDSDGGYLALACPACGAGGSRPELFDPRLGDMGLYADGTALWEHIVEGARDPETEEIPRRVD